MNEKTHYGLCVVPNREMPATRGDLEDALRGAHDLPTRQEWRANYPAPRREQSVNRGDLDDALEQIRVLEKRLGELEASMLTQTSVTERVLEMCTIFVRSVESKKKD